jgi:hypothetical protein
MEQELRDLQIKNEYVFSRKHIDGYIAQAIQESPANENKVAVGTKLIKDWMAGDYYATKNARITQLVSLDIEQLVREIFICIAYYQQEELFVGVSGQLAIKMGFDNHADSIKTMAEILAVLCQTDAFDINKDSDASSLMIQSKISLPVEITQLIARSMYMPPMVCPPDLVETNFESAHLTFNDGLLLGHDNNHSGDLCLDIINNQNQTALQLNSEFLHTVPELPTHDLSNVMKLDQWTQFIEQSKEVYALILMQGNQFWLNTKPDTRGRLYAQGYHVTTQGSPYKKAMIELAYEEVVEGVPE